MSESNLTLIGLRDFTQEDLELISETILLFVKKFLHKKIPEHKSTDYDISIDIDNSKSALNIDIELSLLTNQKNPIEEVIIHEILKDAFSEIEKMLKEKYAKIV